MPKIIGRQVAVGLAKETTRGVGAAPTFWLPHSDISFDDKVLKARSTVTYGSINAEAAQAEIARRHAEGDISFELRDKSFGLILFALLGAKGVSGPTDSAYTHTFTLDNDNDHQSLSVSIDESGIGDLLFRLAMIQSLEITVVPDDIVRGVMTLMSRESIGTAVTPAYIAENKWTGRHLTFKLADTTAGLTAASNISLRRLTLTIEKNLYMVHNTSTVEPEDILNQAFRITGEIELDYESRVYADYMLDGTYKAVRINLNNAQTLLGATSTPQFTLDLSRVDFTEWESSRPLDEIASQTIQFNALWSTANSNVINACSLINTQASY